MPSMGRLVWSKIASEISKQYVENEKCKICGETVGTGENRFKLLSNIYKHFKEKHPEIIEKVRESLS